jgi:hypothetical protein
MALVFNTIGYTLQEVCNVKGVLSYVKGGVFT